MEVGTTSSAGDSERKYKGVRRRRWGKWVSEIRVPGTRERLWLGSYSSPEAAAVAHDTAVFFLRGPGPPDGFNFPDRVGRFLWARISPQSVQRAASDTGMAVDAELVNRRSEEKETEGRILEHDDVACGWDWGGGVQDICFDDLEF